MEPLQGRMSAWLMFDGHRDHSHRLKSICSQQFIRLSVTTYTVRMFYVIFEFYTISAAKYEYKMANACPRTNIVSSIIMSLVTSDAHQTWAGKKRKRISSDAASQYNVLIVLA